MTCTSKFARTILEFAQSCSEVCMDDSRVPATKIFFLHQKLFSSRAFVVSVPVMVSVHPFFSVPVMFSMEALVAVVECATLGIAEEALAE